MPSSILSRFRDDATRYKATNLHQEHEKDVIACYATLNDNDSDDDSDYDSTQSAKPNLNLIRLMPTPKVEDKPLKGLDINEHGGSSIVVHQYRVSDISRQRYTDSLLKDALYFIVVPKGQAVNAASIPDDRSLTKYEIKGEVMMEEENWCITLEQIR